MLEAGCCMVRAAHIRKLPDSTRLEHHVTVFAVGFTLDLVHGLRNEFAFIILVSPEATNQILERTLSHCKKRCLLLAQKILPAVECQRHNPMIPT
jgi:hypothetical protein